jgi:hypothetical protein
MQIHERLARESPAAHLPSLAMSLNTLAVCLNKAGDQATALVTVQHSIAIREDLAQERPAAYLPSLAMSLNALGTIREATAPADAVESYEQAVRALGQCLPKESRYVSPMLLTVAKNLRRVLTDNSLGHEYEPRLARILGEEIFQALREAGTI